MFLCNPLRIWSLLKPALVAQLFNTAPTQVIRALLNSVRRWQTHCLIEHTHTHTLNTRASTRNERQHFWLSPELIWLTDKQTNLAHSHNLTQKEMQTIVTIVVSVVTQLVTSVASKNKEVSQKRKPQVCPLNRIDRLLAEKIRTNSFFATLLLSRTALCLVYLLTK